MSTGLMLREIGEGLVFLAFTLCAITIWIGMFDWFFGTRSKYLTQQADRAFWILIGGWVAWYCVKALCDY